MTAYPLALSRTLRTRAGATYELPLFFPVFHAGIAGGTAGAGAARPLIRGCMCNAFFLYRQRELRKQFEEGQLTLKQYLNYDGLCCTDSGAFQGFTRKLILSNRDIVRFQNRIRTDIAAPLDLVTPPTDKRTVATAKLDATQKRIREGLTLATDCLLAGVQQGGKFLDLRRRSVTELVEMKVKYLAIGSLVPFFNKNHDMKFVADVIREARRIAGPELPMHIYGAGDPVEIPFMVACGADIFDSSSYGHFAEGGWYMTPYGALASAGPIEAGEYRCPCPVCAQAAQIGDVFADTLKLREHNLWMICHTVEEIRRAIAAGTLGTMLDAILLQHRHWFPASALGASWEAAHA